MNDAVIWRTEDIIEATGGHWFFQSDAARSFRLFTFPLGYLQSDTILLHVNGPEWRRKTIEGSGQRDMSIDDLIKYARKFDNVLIISNQKPGARTSIPVLLVDSTYETLFKMAAYQRNRFKGRVVGITGTAGKSSTRDMLATFLSTKGLMWASKGNWNTTEGIAFNLANLSPEGDFAVIEISGGAILGMRGRTALEMVNHHDAIITSIGVNLTSRTPTPKDVAEAKARLFSSLPPGGRAYLTKDVDQLDTLLSAASGYEKRILGDSTKSNISIELLSAELEGTLIRFQHDEFCTEVQTNIIGPGQISNLSLAAQAALDLGVSAPTIEKSIRSLSLAKRKMELSQLTIGGMKVRLLDDCHNATQVSFENALDHLRQVKASNKHSIFIIGRIVHIEGQETSVYQALGKKIASCEPLVVILFDEGLTLLRETLDKLKVKVIYAKTPEKIVTLVEAFAINNCLLFLKGSNRGTSIRKVSSHLRKYIEKPINKRVVGIVRSKWSHNEYNYYLEALDFYDEVIFIDPARVTYRFEIDPHELFIDYNGTELNRLSALYAFEYKNETSILAKALSFTGCEISDTFDTVSREYFGKQSDIISLFKQNTGTTTHIIPSLIASENYINRLDDSHFPLLYKPIERGGKVGNIIFHSPDNVLTFCKKYFKKNNAYLVLEKLVNDTERWCVYIVDSEIVGCYKKVRNDNSTFSNVENQVAPIKVVGNTYKLLTKFVYNNIPKLYEKGACKFDIAINNEGGFYIIGINRRPGFNWLQKIYNINFPAIVHRKISKRATQRDFYHDRRTSASIIFLGDTNLGESYQLRNEEKKKENILKTRGYDEGFKPFLPLLRSSDYSVLNLESVITKYRQSPFQDVKRYLDWTSPTYSPKALVNLGINAVNLANNHALDFGENGLREMLEILDRNGISHFGAGLDESNAATPIHYDLQIGERNIHIIIASGYWHRKNYDTWGYYAKANNAGVNTWIPRQAQNQIKILRKEYPDAFIIAFPHWGENYTYKSKSQEQLAHSLIDAGVDLIIGHGSHMVQEIEQYKDRWIIYSIGNFVYNSPGRYKKLNAAPFGLISRLIFLSIDKKIHVELQLYPIFTDNRVSNYQTHFVTKDEFKQFFEQFLPYKDSNNSLIRHVKTGKNEYGYYFSLNIVNSLRDTVLSS